MAATIDNRPGSTMNVFSRMHSLLSSSGSEVIHTLASLNEQFVSWIEMSIQECKLSITEGHYDTVPSQSQALTKALSDANNTVTMAIKLLPSNSGKYRPSLCLLIESCFKATKETFSLCKEVESNHAHIFDNLTGYIGPLFKSSFILLKTSSEAVDHVCPSLLSSPDYHHLLIKVLHSLFAVSQTILTLDPSLVLLSWKALGKIVCHIKDHTHLLDGSNLSHCTVIHGMCDAMLTKSRECVSNTPLHSDNKSGSTYTKLLKVCRFFATMIVKVIKEYSEYHYQLAQGLVKFLLQLHEILPPSLSCSAVLNNAQLSDIEANISVIIEPLVGALLNCEQFLHHFISSCCRYRSDEDHFSFLPNLLILCLILKNFQKLSESSSRYLLEHTSSQVVMCVQLVKCRLFNAVLNCVKECTVEFSKPVCVPGVVIGGHAPHHVTLYEHLVTNLCSVIAILMTDYFITMERFLFQVLLFNEDFYCSLLVQDIWCFVVRWGTSGLCYSHISALIKLLYAIKDRTSRAVVNIKLLLRRLIAFATPTQQLELFEQFSPDKNENLLFWLCVDFNMLDSSVATDISKALYTSLCKLLLSETSPLICYDCIQCLNELLSEDSAVKPHLPPMMSNLIDQLINMLNGITQLKQNIILHHLLSIELLRLISNLLARLNSTQLLKVFECLYIICNMDHPSEGVLVGVARILARCGTLATPSNDVLQLICACFRCLISHTHSWIVHSEALEAFKLFAEVTPHATILEGCIPTSLNDTVVNYLQKIPFAINGLNMDSSEILFDLIRRDKEVEPLVTIDHASSNSAPPLEDVIILDDQEEQKEQRMECSEAVSLLMEQWNEVKQLPLLSTGDMERLTLLNNELTVMVSEC